MVKNKSGGSKTKFISKRVSKKTIQAENPDFENSFFGVVQTKPNGLICSVKVLEPPKDKLSTTLPSTFNEDFCKQPIQVNIGKLKHDKRNNMLSPGDYVQVEIYYDMKRQNGNTFATVLCRYSTSDIKDFVKEGLLNKEVENSLEEDPFEYHSSGSDKVAAKQPQINESLDLDDL